MENDQNGTLNHEKELNIIFWRSFRNKSSWHKESNRIRCKNWKKKQRFDDKDLIIQTPNVGEPVGSTDREAKAQRAEKSSSQKEVEMEVDQTSDS